MKMVRIKNFFCLFLFLLFFSQKTIGSSAVTVETRIDQIVNNAMRQYSIPGMAVAVIKDGKPLIIKGYGFANFYKKVPVTTDTLFALGSVSKVITGFALMTLIEENKVKLDDSILNYIPNAPKQWQRVTIRQLLSHSSGIPQYQGSHLPWNKMWSFMAKKPMEFQPGSSVQYNNFGYIILGRVIENVSQMSLQQFLNQTIFTPLNMLHTSFPNTLYPNGLALGYRVMSGEIINNPNMTPWDQMWSSGGLVSTINDMINWDIAMSKGKILTRNSYNLMWSPTFLNNNQPAGHFDWAWSLGWQVSYSQDKLVARKNGAIRGYSSWMIRHIDDHISIILLANTNNIPLRRIANNIYQELKYTSQ